MAEDIESYEFRTQARRNGYQYGEIFIYKNFDVQIYEYGMPRYKLKGAVGAIEALAGLLQNVHNGLENDPSAKHGKNLPGVDTPDADFERSLSISGPMYLLDYSDFRDKTAKIDELAHRFGWETQKNKISVVYRPNSDGAATDLYCEDPVTAAARTMMTSAMKHQVDAVAVLTGKGNDQEYAKNIVALENDGVQQTFGGAYDAFMANTGGAIAGKWKSAGMPLVMVREGASTSKSVNLVPTSITVTPRAYVVDESSNGRIYPTCFEISLQLANPYGKLLVTNTDKGEEK